EDPRGARLSGPSRQMVRCSWCGGGTGHDRQRLSVQVACVRRPLSLPWYSPHPNAALHAAHQRQSGTAHSNAFARVGLSLHLPLLGATASPSRSLPALLQSSPRSPFARRAAADQSPHREQPHETQQLARPTEALAELARLRADERFFDPRAYVGPAWTFDSQ